MVYKRYTMLMVKKPQYYKDISFQINLNVLHNSNQNHPRAILVVFNKPILKFAWKRKRT